MTGLSGSVHGAGAQGSVRDRALDAAREALASQQQQMGVPSAPRMDETTLSEELLEEVSRVGGNGNDIEGLLKGLAEQYADPEGKNGNAGGGGDDQKKKPQIKREYHWNPSTSPEELHGGRDVIGTIEIKEEKVEPPGEGKGAGGARRSGGGGPGGGSAGGGGSAAGAGAGNGAASTGAGPSDGAAGTGTGAPHGATSTGNANDSAPAQASSGGNTNSGDGEDQSELSQEAQELAGQMAGSQAQASGIPNLGAGGAEQGASGGGSFEVRTRATGATQSVRVEGAGKLDTGSFLRTFQKLDDQPLLNSPTLHRQKGRDAAKQLEEQARQGGEKPDEETLKKLREPTES